MTKTNFEIRANEDKSGMFTVLRYEKDENTPQIICYISLTEKKIFPRCNSIGAEELRAITAFISTYSKNT